MNEPHFKICDVYVMGLCVMEEDIHTKDLSASLACVTICFEAFPWLPNITSTRHEGDFIISMIWLATFFIWRTNECFILVTILINIWLHIEKYSLACRSTIVRWLTTCIKIIHTTLYNLLHNMLNSYVMGIVCVLINDEVLLEMASPYQHILYQFIDHSVIYWTYIIK